MKTKKRRIGLYVENEVGALARVSGLFSGKSYNLNSLTVGATEDETISRMTISLTSDDQTFEQIKKQLNRSVEVIKIIDYTDLPVHQKELMFIKINGRTRLDISEIGQLGEIYGLHTIDVTCTSALLESLHAEEKNDELIEIFSHFFPNQIEIVRGGGVAIEAPGRG